MQTSVSCRACRGFGFDFTNRGSNYCRSRHQQILTNRYGCRIGCHQQLSGNRLGFVGSINNSRWKSQRIIVGGHMGRDFNYCCGDFNNTTLDSPPPPVSARLAGDFTAKLLALANEAFVDAMRELGPLLELQVTGMPMVPMVHTGMINSQGLV